MTTRPNQIAGANAGFRFRLWLSRCPGVAQAMFMMERSRGVDAGWRDVVPQIGDADVGEDSIAHLARALRIFVESHPQHPDVGSAIWALGALRADGDAEIFEAVLRDGSGYGSHAREQAQCALEVIRP